MNNKSTQIRETSLAQILTTDTVANELMQGATSKHLPLTNATRKGIQLAEGLGAFDTQFNMQLQIDSELETETFHSGDFEDTISNILAELKDAFGEPIDTSLSWNRVEQLYSDGRVSLTIWLVS